MSDICHHRLYDVSVLISSRLDILKLVTILILGLYFSSDEQDILSDNQSDSESSMDMENPTTHESLHEQTKLRLVMSLYLKES